jgi:TolB protein
LLRFVLAVFISAACLAQEPSHLENTKQLTFGGQNAEAYWAPDGKRLIFQSTRDTLACDQEFIINADGSNVHMVSTGKGRTTCGYFLADDKHIVYASTHEGGDACPPAADRSKGYLWAVYPTYDIYLATDDGKIVKKLTDTPGYDAEATVNWKTGKIIYTSLASGDLDLWTMKSDGSDKKRLTTAPRSSRTAERRSCGAPTGPERRN